MNTIKKIIAKYFKSFTYFYIQLRHRLFIFVLLSILVGILDGLGLAMFMPLLELVNDVDKAQGNTLGNLKFVVDFLQGIGLNMNIITILFIMIFFFIVKGIIKFIVYSYITIVQQFFIEKIRHGMLNDFNRISYKYFIKSDIGRIQNTMSGEVTRVSVAFKSYASTLEQGLLVIVYMSFAFFVDFKFAFLVTVGGALSNFIYKLIYKHTKEASSKFTKDSHKYQGQIIQYIANFKYLKATGKLLDYAGWLHKSVVLIEKSRRKIGILNAVVMSVREPLLIIVVAAVIIIQTMYLNSSLAPILVSLLFFYRALNALMGMQNFWNRFLAVSGSLDNVSNFQNEIKRHKENKGKNTFQKFNNSLQLNKASFLYNTVPVLKNIDLEIHKNETIAFVGESGSGKTTLVNVIAGLMPLDTGKFLIDGNNAGGINITTYQNRIGYITQEPAIFNDTMFNNITFWSEENSESIAKFEEILHNSSLYEFVNSLPAGKDTLLGNNGINISGGQKQRIAIARELYKDIDILIMDEATSSLDSETEMQIQKSIDNLKGKYTILIVAHRLSTIKNADKIVFLSKGKIEEVATYNELLIRSKQFRRMLEMQELG